MSRIIIPWGWLLAVVLIPASVPAAAPAHPLLGQVWDVREARRVEAEVVLGRAARSAVLLLGEAHGNPAHHALQLDLLQRLAARDRRPTLVFEIFDRADQAAIDRLRAAGTREADRFAEAAGVGARGWDWPQYRPLVQLALDRDWPIAAGNLSRADARRIAAEGIGNFEDGWLLPRLRDRLSPADRERLEQRVMEAHCGHLPRAHVAPMVDVQQARDAYMAEHLERAASDAVLVAGAQHVRLDYGVPRYLDDGERAAALSIAFVEVREGEHEVADYLGGEGVVYDYLWFTPRSTPEDPCAHFAEQLERMRQRISQ